MLKGNGSMTEWRISTKAQELYNGSEEIEVYEYDTENGTRYVIKDFMIEDGLTLDELMEVFAELEDE